MGKPRWKMQPDNVRAVQVELVEVIGELGEVAKGARLDGVAVGTSSTAIPHGLGRVPLHWFEVSPANVDRARTAAAPDATYLYLQAPSAITVNLVVY